MNIDDCFQLGYIVKTHGLSGELVAELETDRPEDYIEMETVFLERSGNLFPFFISHSKLNGMRLTCKLEDVDDVDSARELIGSRLFLPLTHLPPLEHGQFYFHELIGCTVFEDDQMLGPIQQIYQHGGKALAGIDHEGTEVLIPVEQEFLTKVNIEEKIVVVRLPDGLLQVFTK